MAKTGSKLISINDEELVKMALDGNQKAFTALHAKYQLAVFLHVGKIIQDPEEAADVCIESFANAFQKLDTFDRTKKFSTWLFAIAKNKALDHSIKQSGKSKGMVDVLPIDSPDVGQTEIADEEQPGPEEVVIMSQDHEKFLSCIEGLPELYRDIAKMCYVDYLGYKEISEKTELPINTVKTRISRAKALIVEKMLEEE